MRMARDLLCTMRDGQENKFLIFLRLIKEITIFAMCIIAIFTMCVLIILIFAVAMLADVTNRN